MREITVPMNEVTPGMEVIFKTTDGCGQGGTVVAITATTVDLVCGEAKYERTLDLAKWPIVVRETYLDADECLEFGSGDCKGNVDYHITPGGRSAMPRCDHHNAKRWERYENSETEKYAYSDVAPPGFDYMDAGEYWSEDDY